MKLNLYWALAVAALAVAIPVGVKTFILGATGQAPSSWWFTAFPGFGLGTVMLLGQAMVARAAVTMKEASRPVRLGLATCWAIVFACMLIVLPLALYAGAEGQSVSAAIDSLLAGGVAGLLKIGWYVLLILAVEGVVPALLVASRIEILAKEGAARVAQESAAAMAERAEAALTGVRAGSAKEGVLLVLEEGPATAAEIAERAGYKESTVRSTAGVLEREEKLARVPGKRPVVYELRGAQPLPGVEPE